MNVMRKFLLGSGGGNSSSANSAQASNNVNTKSDGVIGIKPSPSQHAALSLTHLRKLFSDYTNPAVSQNLTDVEREVRVYAMLPLFCRVFTNSSPQEIAEKFPEVVPFCQHVSRLAVSEIRKRASDQCTVAASSAIAKFLEMDEEEEASNGWMLLTALNILSIDNAGLIEVMTIASIPSTLVKCLYLFFDLPNTGTASDRRIILQKVFGQILIRLCSHPAAAEELARKDDLTLLFSALSSWCPTHNLAWRKIANESLVALTRHGLTPSVLGYIHNKGCISLCVENMQRAADLSPMELVEMFVTVFCLLKDSAEITQSLLDDFRTCQGYSFITEFLLRTENDFTAESQEALRNLVFLMSSLTCCGFNELRPIAVATGSPFQLPGFTVPSPIGKGSSVRNLAAFQVLQNCFIKSGSPVLCSTILDAILNIYQSDNANYFILESQNTLSQFAEKIHSKSDEIQLKYFRVLEFVVFQLNYVPCKELISLSLLLRNRHSTQCSIHCMVALLSILRHHTIFKDVYREVGLLEILVSCLQRFARSLKDKAVSLSENTEYTMDAMEEQLGFLVMEALSVLLVGNVNNAAIFRESGGARCAHNLVPLSDCRREALGIVQQLILSTGGDDDMGTLLGLLQSSAATHVSLKTDILKSLLTCLRESHRSRMTFRKVGGFVYIMSALVAMEASLSAPPGTQWESFATADTVRFLHLVFNTLCVAMRYEPANAKFFQLEICATSLCDTVRLFGCFVPAKTFGDCQLNSQMDLELVDKYSAAFHDVFIGGVQNFGEIENLPRTLVNATIILRLLYDLSIDAYDKSQVNYLSLVRAPLAAKKSTEGAAGNEVGAKRPALGSLNLNSTNAEPYIVHPGVVLAMLQLVPSISHPTEQQAAVALQLFVTDVLRSVLRLERNVQLLCDAGFPGEILRCARNVLIDESHYLNTPMVTILERLACQALEPRDLREFLRLGNPLNCLPPEFNQSEQTSGGVVPLSRLKTLVSMATPRDFCHRGTSTLTLPPFVEFDMQPEGFGCLFLPSIAPQCFGTGGVSSVSGGGSSIMGGIGGGGDRVFPAQTGMTFSTWICVDKFSDPRLDPHGVRLLTLVRNIVDREENLICLSAVLSPRDKALLVSTQETLLPKGSSDWEPEIVGDFGVRVWSPDLIQEGQWHHLALVWNRAVLKNSQFSLYVDGQLVHSGKMHYISQNPGGAAANLTVASSVYGYIGTAPSWRRPSRLVWRQGACHLVEDALSAQAIQWIYKLGPHYTGSLQAPELTGNPEPLCSLAAEDRIVLGLNAQAMSPLTLAKIRKVYRKADSRAISKQLGMSSHENATPIRILHNTAGHLSGPARTLGGVVIGYLGVRVFCPRPVSITVQEVGGCHVLLGLVAMATDVESLYAAVKALVCIGKSSGSMHREMERCHGYQTLAYLLKRHKHLVNNHILHLILTLVGTADSARDCSNSTINNLPFRDLLIDLDVWRDTPDDLLRFLFEHLYQIASESSDSKQNLKYMRDLNLVSRLIFALHDYKLTAGALNALWNLLGVLLNNNPRPVDLVGFGQLTASLLPTQPICDERDLQLNSKDSENFSTVESIKMRNDSLSLVLRLLQNRKVVNSRFSEELNKNLGFDWLLLFLQPKLHPSTVVSALSSLVLMLSVPPLLAKFRENAVSEAWRRSTDLVILGKMGTFFNFQINSPGPLRLVGRTFSVTEESLQQQQQQQQLQQQTHAPGFQQLSWLLSHHVQIPQVYYYIIGLMIGQPLPKTADQVDLDALCTCLFGVGRGQGSSASRGIPVYCPEAINILFAMIRVIMNPDTKTDGVVSEAVLNYPNVIIQFLFYVYHNAPDYLAVFITADILNSIVATLFPSSSSSEVVSEATSPVDDFMPYALVDHSEGRESPLTSHSAKKSVIDFLRTIVIDSLSLSTTNKTPPVIDIILDGCPESSTHIQQCIFQTELLSAVMEYLVSADIILGDQGVLPIVHGGNAQNLTANIFYFAGRLVDKLWQGVLQKDGHQVLDFVIQLIAQAKKRGIASATLTLDNLYRCLNRCVLFLLSRPMDAVTKQTSVMETLHKLTTNRNLVFGAGNHDLEFIGCLTYCLLQLTSDMKIMIEPSYKTTWHVNPQNSVQAEDIPSGVLQAQNLISLAARRVWEELYVSKKPAIEEAFKVSLGMANKAPSLELIRDQVRDPALKVWLNYIDGERRSVYRTTLELPNQIQSKIQKVTGGLTRLASRTKAKREETTVRMRCASMSWSEMTVSTQQYLVSLNEKREQMLKQYQEAQQHTEKYLYHHWKTIQDELLRERGLWGPTQESKLTRWMLDITEGPCRMRKKLARNPLFYIHYPYRPSLENGDSKSLKYKVANSLDSKLHHELYSQWKPTLMNEKDAELITKSEPVKPLLSCSQSVEVGNAIGEIVQLADLKILTRPRNEDVLLEGDEDNEPAVASDALVPLSTSDFSESAYQQPQDSQSLLRLLKENERISHLFRCARVQGLDTVEGLLLFGKEHLYVVDGFTLTPSREIRDLTNVPAGTYEPIVPPYTTPGYGGSSPNSAAAFAAETKTQHLCYTIAYEDVREVHKRRYLLQAIALEIFSNDGLNYLLAFPPNMRNKVYQRLLATSTGLSDSASQSVAGQKRNANIEQGAGLLSSLMGETSVTQRWVRGEISNFQYLMHLNTLAGRSYNDLMQYPVFPWVLADYESPELDLTNPATFRDFSRPMGAQTPDRLAQFRKRYKEWDDPHNETGPYHYGTHYSSAMIVCSYLLRLEPFTQHFLHLQGGHFDLADRMFHSVKEGWLSASAHNMADVKELIPEFFYLPEFLTNHNKFDLGLKQSGVALNDVLLPPWAKDDPHEFIRMHRAALECDYVSQHLHEWIDLIFGYKQQGPAAVEAVNVFHPLFYEGNVDIYSIEDPLKKNAVIGFINNFGQIPKQLFKKPHPSKRTNRTSVIDLPIPLGQGLIPLPGSASLSAISQDGKDYVFFHNVDHLSPSLQPVKELKRPVGQILHVDRSVIAVEENKCLLPSNFSRCVAWGYADRSLRILPHDSERAIHVCETPVNGEVLTCVCPNAKTIITGSTNSVITVWELGKKQLTIKDHLYGHTEAVTCLAASPGYQMLVSGSRDLTAIVWDLSRLTFVRQLRNHTGPLTAVAINESTGKIATCSGTWLHLWSINGDPLASVNTLVGQVGRSQHILCVQFSLFNEWDPLNVILTGSTDGVVRMWSLDYVQVPKSEAAEAETSPTSIPANKKEEEEENEVLLDNEIECESLDEDDECQDKAESSNTQQPLTQRRPSLTSLPSLSSLESEGPTAPPRRFRSSSSSSAGGASNQTKQSKNDTSSLTPIEDKVDESAINQEQVPSGESPKSVLHNSCSDGSLNESFVVISNTDVQDPDHKKSVESNAAVQSVFTKRSRHVLKEGFKWQRQLIFRSKLTMHTAYDRPDNNEPSSVTAIGLSKDHRTVYVGDARGRIYSWSVTDVPGRSMADHWLKDDTVECCTQCRVRFTLTERRHHCRNCGQVFCSKCSRYESEIRRLRIQKPVRVCQSCFQSLKAANES